jgi:hypothetical protein
MTASENLNPHQTGEMKRRLESEGGFTYNPRSKSFVSEGYSVAAHPAAELRVHGGADEAHLQGYIAGSAPLWSQQKGKGRGNEMIGGWRSDTADVLDIPKVFPASPEGHTKSRQAQVLRGQEASFSLHGMEEDPNPWFTGSASTPPAHLASQFPEFGNLVAKKPNVSLDPEKYPETASWSQQPVREAGYARESKIKARRAAQT